MSQNAGYLELFEPQYQLLTSEKNCGTISRSSAAILGNHVHGRDPGYIVELVAICGMGSSRQPREKLEFLLVCTVVLIYFAWNII